LTVTDRYLARHPPPSTPTRPPLRARALSISMSDAGLQRRRARLHPPRQRARPHVPGAPPALPYLTLRPPRQPALPHVSGAPQPLHLSIYLSICLKAPAFGNPPPPPPSALCPRPYAVDPRLATLRPQPCTRHLLPAPWTLDPRRATRQVRGKWRQVGARGKC